MCLVSDKIKFCTCAAKSTEQLKHSWEFRRYDEERDYMVVGLTMEPYGIDELSNRLNQELLLQRVNDPTAWDTELNPKEKDRLLLNFNCGNNYQNLFYGFTYHNHKWCAIEYDTFEWMEKHHEESFGKIKNALAKK